MKTLKLVLAMVKRSCSVYMDGPVGHFRFDISERQLWYLIWCDRKTFASQRSGVQREALLGTAHPSIARSYWRRYAINNRRCMAYLSACSTQIYPKMIFRITSRTFGFFARSLWIGIGSSLTSLLINTRKQLINLLF